MVADGNTVYQQPMDANDNAGVVASGCGWCERFAKS
jgi:hypothetical protein